MEPQRRKAYVCAAMLSLLVVFVVGSSALQAQTKQLLTWSNDLNYLQSVSSDELVQHRDAVIQIRTGIEFWLKMHPDSKIELQPAPAQPWGAEEIRNQVSSLRKAVEAIMAEDNTRPFNLGMTEVSVTAEASPLSPVADTIDRNEVVNRQAVTTATALDYLPGVTIDHVTSNRNEAGMRIRGFRCLFT